MILKNKEIYFKFWIQIKNIFIFSFSGYTVIILYRTDTCVLNERLALLQGQLSAWKSTVLNEVNFKIFDSYNRWRRPIYLRLGFKWSVLGHIQNSARRLPHAIFLF
jgi:hypothetical protein